MAAENTKPGANTRPGPTDWTPDPPKAPSAFAKHHAALQSEQDRKMIERNVPESARSLLTDPRYLAGDPDAVAEMQRRLTDEESRKNPIPADDVEQQRYEGGLKNSRLDAEDRREVISLARAANVTPEDLADAVRTFEQSRPQEKAFSYEEGEAALRKIWGPEYESNVEKAQEWLRSRPALWRWLHETGAGSHPSVVQAVVALATKSSGIQAEINRLMADRRGPYWESSHPESKAVRARVAELHRKLYAGIVEPA